VQLWQATNPQATSSLCGRSVMPISGRPANLIASDEYHWGRWRD
jgi:hypothetical protein